MKLSDFSSDGNVVVAFKLKFDNIPSTLPDDSNFGGAKEIINLRTRETEKLD